MKKLRIGEYNELVVGRLVDFGAYLHPAGSPDEEILLPGKFIEEPVKPGDKMRVFVYNDSEDRPIATTERPYATVGHFVYLQVVDVNRVGAFMDWGLESKQLLVPFSEQNVKMRTGMEYLVYVYLDDASGRVVGSAKIDKFLGNKLPPYKMGDEVEALVIQHLEGVGYKVIVDELYKGIIYDNSLFQPLVIGEPIRACVKYVRPDGKIDLTAGARVEHRIDAIAERIMAMLADHPDHTLDLTDKSPAEQIAQLLQCSKKDFKRAVGQLFKARKIAIETDRIRLA